MGIEMSRVVRPADVEQDLADLSEFIARDSLQAAVRFLEAAEKAFELLAQMPEIGSVWETHHPRLAGLRVWPIRGFEKYLIFYRPIPDGIEGFHVLHGARDFQVLFGPRGKL
jgi:toxin ParE1/3/4